MRRAVWVVPVLLVALFLASSLVWAKDRPRSDYAVLTPTMAYKAARVEATMAAAGYPVKRVETRRSKSRQHWLKQKGKSFAGPEEGAHVRGEAVDWAFEGPKPYSEDHPWELLGAACEAQGLVWGGRWETLRDYGHCEIPRG